MPTQQLGKGALLDNLTVAQDQDQIGLPNGGETVGDNESGPCRPLVAPALP